MTTASMVAALQRLSGREMLINAETADAFLSNVARFSTVKPEEIAGFEATSREVLSLAYGFDDERDSNARKPFVYQDGVAVIPIHGSLINRFSGSWGFVTGYNFIQRMLNLALDDDDVDSIVFDVDSPGGEATAGFSSARLLRQLSDKGAVKVEIHASGLCASACTWILASGTPGYRYIDAFTLVLIHPVQKGSMFGSSCIERQSTEKSQDDKLGNAYLDLARDLYMKFTGQSKETVEKWLSCGHEQAGQGQLAVTLKMADVVED